MKSYLIENWEALYLSATISHDRHILMKQGLGHRCVAPQEFHSKSLQYFFQYCGPFSARENCFFHQQQGRRIHADFLTSIWHFILLVHNHARGHKDAGLRRYSILILCNQWDLQHITILPRNYFFTKSVLVSRGIHDTQIIASINHNHKPRGMFSRLSQCVVNKVLVIST